MRQPPGLLLRHGGQVEPFPSIFRASAIGVVRVRYDAGERSVRALATSGDVEVCEAPTDWDESVWRNLNTLSDFATFLSEHPLRLDPRGAGP
jgi:hypothetical protein